MATSSTHQQSLLDVNLKCQAFVKTSTDASHQITGVKPAQPTAPPYQMAAWIETTFPLQTITHKGMEMDGKGVWQDPVRELPDPAPNIVDVIKPELSAGGEKVQIHLFQPQRRSLSIFEMWYHRLRTLQQPSMIPLCHSN